MAINVMRGKYPHVGWVDIEGQGVVSEIAIMSNKPNGLMFIKLNQLDAIDKQRLFRVISNRNSHLYELWDLMSNLTLGNGANALEYFHQYVKILTPSGQVMTPQMGVMGVPGATGMTNTANAAANAAQNASVIEAFAKGLQDFAHNAAQNPVAPQPVQTAPAPQPAPPVVQKRGGRPRKNPAPSGTE